MEEPILKKKSMINKIFKNQLLLTMSTAFLLIFVVVGSSYAIFNSKTETGLNDVIVESGNLLATISSPSETIEMNYTSLGVSDEIGLTYEPYTFTVTNNGENVIKYYELRIVDKEHELSNLPHKSINYALSKNGEDYSLPQNLGDNHGYIYVGGSLESSQSDTFDLKLWVNEEFGEYANNKELKASIELTIYSDIPTRNNIIYDTQGGSYVSKTNISSKRVTNHIPLKSGYSFIGWSTSINGEVDYESDAIYDGNNGTILYALWTEATITYNLNGGIGDIPSNKASEGITILIPNKEGYIFMGWSSIQDATEPEYKSGDAYAGKSVTLYAIYQEKINMMNSLMLSADTKTTISEVHFIDISDEELSELTVGTFDLTHNNQGKVTGWLVEDENDASKNVLYVGSDGLTYLTSYDGYYGGFFDGLTALTNVTFANADTSKLTSMAFMFLGCSSLETVDLSGLDTSNVVSMKGMFMSSGLKSIDLSGLDVSNVTDMEQMFNNCTNLVSVDLTGWDVSNVTNMNSMFLCNSNLKTIYADTNWQTVATKLEDSLNMFLLCNNLVGAVSFNWSGMDVTMANPDTGYFTRKDI